MRSLPLSTVPAQKGALMKKQAYVPFLNSRPLRDTVHPAAGQAPCGGSARRNRTAEAAELPKNPLVQWAAQEAVRGSAGFPGLPGQVRHIPSGPVNLRRRTGVRYGGNVQFPSCRAAWKEIPASAAQRKSACAFPPPPGTERPNRHAFHKPGRSAAPPPES